jgi:hypothetical protein
MKWRYLVAGCLILTALIAALFGFAKLRNQTVPIGAVDPAFEFYTKGRSNSYAAVDRWAHYGMRAERFVDVLQNAGYHCQQPTVSKDGVGTGSIRETLCRKTEQGLLSRTLSIQASIEHGTVARLVEAKASSTLTSDGQSLSKHLADLLRKFGWIEPETLRVAGFQVDSIDTLGRVVADTLSPTGWHVHCTDGQLVEQCKKMAGDRMKSGFPALPQGALPTGTALELHRAMERIHFVPVQKRGADGKPEDSLLLRLAKGRLWLDFVSKDLSGRDLTASIELESKGGTPINLVLGWNGDSKSIHLAGSPRLANDGSVVYLLPEAGTQDARYATWVNLPNKNFPGTFDQLAQKLPRVDAAFIAAMAEAIIGDSARNASPEENLGLYPVLRLIEQKAEVVRALQPDRWLPREHGNRLIAQAYPEDPATRAAWAFATCESIGKPATINGNCLLRFTTADPDAAALVRSEIAKQQLLYGDLPESHPLRIRLKYLNDSFATE